MLEGAPFWLCLLVEDPFQAAAPVVFAGEHFDEGFYFVKIKWYEFVRNDSKGQRCYRLLADEHMLSVHSLIRCEVKPLPSVVNDRRRDPQVPLFALIDSQFKLIAEHTSIDMKI